MPLLRIIGLEIGFPAELDSMLSATPLFVLYPVEWRRHSAETDEALSSVVRTFDWAGPHRQSGAGERRSLARQD
jgi:hypothetical protein